MVGLIDIIDVAQSGGSGFFASNFVMMIVLFFFAATTALVAYPPSFLKKKYERFMMARSILKGDDVKCLTMIQLLARVIKHHQKLEIRPGERWIESSVDIGGEVLGSKDEDYIRKYWTFAPGLTFDQRPDGYHVRVVDDDHDCVLMSSLGYWAFHCNEEIREYAFQKVRESGTGNHGSYLLLGKNTVVDEAYEAMKKFFHRKYCSFSASGFLACMNLVANLAPKGGLIFMDEKCHICLRLGSKLSGAKVIKFPHQDFDALRELMVKNRHKFSGRCLLVLDGIYSADGTIADLPRARKLADEFKVEIVMDEAHSMGSIGRTGHGIEEYFDMVGACDYICGVFSKSLSTYGGYVVSNNEDVQVLTVSPGVGFATGPHSFTAACVTKGVEIIERDNGKTRAAIDVMRKYYVKQLKEVAKCANLVNCGHTVFVIYPHLYAAATVAVELRKKGFLVSSFMFPSVPVDRSILRLTITPLTTTKILDDFSTALGQVMKELTPRFGEDVMYGHRPHFFQGVHFEGLV